MDDAGSSPARGAKGTYTPYMAAYLKARYRRRMDEAIVKLGGKCASCASTQELELDHVDRRSKISSVSQLWSARTEIFDEELKKCQLLCKPCHSRKTLSEISIEHGGGASGKRNCKCDPCRIKKAEYMANKNYNENRCRRRNCSCNKRHYAS